MKKKLAAIVFFAYLPSLWGSFVGDDVPALWWTSDSNWLRAATGPRPLSSLLWLVEFRFFGPHIALWHLVSITLHIAIAFAVLKLLTMIGIDRRAAFIGAAAFALHPLMTQSVAYMSAQPTLLCALFFVATLTVAANLTKKLTVGQAAALIALMMLAAASKEEAVALPLAAAGMYAILNGKRSNLALTAAAVLTLALFAIKAPTGRDPTVLSLDKQIVNDGAEPMYMLSKLVMPVNLSFDPDPIVLPAAVPIVILTATALVTFFAPLPMPLRTAALLITFAPVWLRSHVSFIEEHHAYIVGFAVAFIAAWLAEKIKNNKAVIAALLAMAVMTFHRVGAWHTPVTLYADAASKAKTNPRPATALGAAFENNGNYMAALAAYQRALDIDPNFKLAKENMNNILKAARR